MTITVKEIIINFLKENNFDGLTDERDCHCALDDPKFMGCSKSKACWMKEELKECSAGYKVPCDKPEHNLFKDDDCTYHIVLEKVNSPSETALLRN